jgi:hypothetical protein
LGLRGSAGGAWHRRRINYSLARHQFLDAWFLNERIIVEAPGYPSAEDERCRRYGRLIARLGNTVGRSCLRAAT